MVEAAATVLYAQQHAILEAAVADARDDIASPLASSALNRDTSAADVDQDLRQDWLRALERLLPATIAVDRAAAAAAARSAAVDQRAAARRRHPNIDDLLPYANSSGTPSAQSTRPVAVPRRARKSTRVVSVVPVRRRLRSSPQNRFACQGRWRPPRTSLRGLGKRA